MIYFSVKAGYIFVQTGDPNIVQPHADVTQHPAIAGAIVKLYEKDTPADPLPQVPISQGTTDAEGNIALESSIVFPVVFNPPLFDKAYKIVELTVTADGYYEGDGIVQLMWLQQGLGSSADNPYPITLTPQPAEIAPPEIFPYQQPQNTPETAPTAPPAPTAPAIPEPAAPGSPNSPSPSPPITGGNQSPRSPPSPSTYRFTRMHSYLFKTRPTAFILCYKLREKLVSPRVHNILHPLI